LAELETQLLLSAEVGLAKPLEIVPLASEVREIQKMIAGIQRKLAIRNNHECLRSAARIAFAPIETRWLREARGRYGAVPSRNQG
jgi:hypothetical protein